MLRVMALLLLLSFDVSDETPENRIMERPSKKNSISNHLSHHHRELDESFRQYQQFQVNGAEEAQRSWSDFEQGMRRHMTWEEELLFPMFEERTGLDDHGPTAIMRGEHREIVTLLDRIRGVSADGSPVDDLVRALAEWLTAHNRKEETILYPWIDRLLSEAESDRLLITMQIE